MPAPYLRRYAFMNHLEALQIAISVLQKSQHLNAAEAQRVLAQFLAQPVQKDAHPACEGPRAECKWCKGDPNKMACSGLCDACPVRCCRAYGHLPAYFDNGFKPLPGPRLPDLALDLPGFMPQVERPVQGEYGAVLVTAEKLFNRHWQKLALRWGGQYKHLNPGGLVGAHFFTHDSKMEAIWQLRRETHFLERLAQSDLDFVISPEYSDWTDDPAWEQRYAITRAQVLAVALAQLGVKVIPAIVGTIWDWAGLIPQRGWVAVNLQMATTTTWKRMMEHLEQVADMVGQDVGIIVNGAGQPYKQREVDALLKGWQVCHVRRDKWTV